ncbi:uncharacterized protein N7503_007096 [Penicillium pulvis]|uniref:uncharacterized protein n=1 Tax=Penicillium pulvis TaxID=1562058 RepID=UPI00254783A6|nr:uncharacterized protein N7503_007096 [Penicillium pulvis]KAJ5797800.1 hypothetical protein N7503_007096 [Penicillium pulvis]
MTGPIHLSPCFTFHPDSPHEAVLALDIGIRRLISLLPFLAGNVALSRQLESKENVREVQPATAEFLREHPLFKTKSHNMSISPMKPGPIFSRDIMMTDEFVPIETAMAMRDQIPIFRAQANVMHDGVIICFSFYHMALDGFGFCNAMKCLAECCRNPDLTALLTDPCKEAQARRTIFEAMLDSNFQQEQHALFGENYDDVNGTPNTTPGLPISRVFTLDAARVESLQNVCNALLRRQSDTNVVLSKNVIVSSLMWLCFLRSRYRSLSTESHSDKDTIPEKSCLAIGVDVRNLLQLPLSYMGNAVLGVQIFTELDAILASLAQSNGDSMFTEDVSPDDVVILANLARQTHETTQKITGPYVKGEISQRCASNDWASYARPGDISVSSIRRLSLYGLDFGSSLGRVRNVDLPENRIPGVGWIMPIRFEGAPWEVSIAFEPRIMEGVQGDRLMKWVCAKSMPKL